MESSIDQVAAKCGKQLGKSVLDHSSLKRSISARLVCLTDAFYLKLSVSLGRTTDTFQRCILANQQNPGVCEPYKIELSRCAAKAVPLLNEIKNRCAAQVIGYDKCLEQYTSLGDAELEKNCTPKLRDLWFCTEKVKRELENKDNVEMQKNRLAGKEALSK